MRFYLIIVELPQKYNFFMQNTLHTPFFYPWSSKSLAVSEFFHSANTLPLAKRMLFTMSIMLGIGYSPMRRMENSMAKMRW